MNAHHGALSARSSLAAATSDHGSQRHRTPASRNIPAPRDVAEVHTHDGATVLLRRHGNPSGPRLVLSHGNGLSADAYYPFWSLLTDDFDLVLYDFRNHGWNPVGEPGAHRIETFVRDNACVAGAIDQHFGPRPRIGVFHSTSALTAILPGAECHGYTALVLFDPPTNPRARDLRVMRAAERLGRRLARTASTRRESFTAWEELAQTYRDSAAFRFLCPGAADYLARTTLRRSAGAYALCCPRSYEAQIFAQMFQWSTRADYGRLRCPAKVIGGDPVVPFSFLPSVHLPDIVALDYDFLPDTTHFLQLEQPAACATLMLEFLEHNNLCVSPTTHDKVT